MVKKLDILPEFEKCSVKIGEYKRYLYEKSLSDEMAAGLSVEDVIWMYRWMLYIRRFELMISELYSGGLVPYKDYKFMGATHLSVGQEAVAVGANIALREDDYITSSHRGHGHSIGKGAWALTNFSEEKLRDFIGKGGYKGKGQTLLTKAIDVHLYRTIAELLGKEEGYCRGRGGGMHIADLNVGHLGANAIVGGSLGIATGAGLSAVFQGQDRICVCFHGDGAANTGIWHESLNMACMAQFQKTGVPVVYLVENNQYGMTGQGWGEITGIDYVARRGSAYSMSGMHAEVVNGMDVLAVRDAVLRAADICRSGNGPVLLEVMTYRFLGHSLSDPQRYRSKTEIEEWRKEDPIIRLENELIANGIISSENSETMKRQVEEHITELVILAASSADPDPVTITAGLFSDTTTEDIDPSLATPQEEVNKSDFKDGRDKEGRMSYRHAVCEAMIEEMERDSRIVFYGEDVAEHGGAFAVNVGMYEIFGPRRVFNTAISEAAIIGSAVGMAITGLRPIVELMFLDFIWIAMDQIGNQAAKNKYMFGGKATIPMVIRTAAGGGKGYAGQHSQSLEATLTHVPGLKVVAPSTAYDAKGLLKSAIRDDNPVVFIEHQLLYNSKQFVPKEEYTIPLGEAAILREGSDVTIVTYSYMTQVALKAAELLEKDGISCEVIDIRTLIPLDLETILVSTRKTKRALVLNQAPQTGCFGEHIAFEIQYKAFDYLDGPVEVFGAYDVPPPMAQTLEEENLPRPESTRARVLTMLNR